MTAHTRQIPNITNIAARQVLEASLTAAEAGTTPYSIAIVDAAGHLVAFSRMDGAAAQSAQVAQDKAYTAAGFGLPTGQWPSMLADNAPLALGVAGIDRLIPFGGGLPIVIEGATVGGIGVSGGHWSQDITIAEAGLTAIS